MRQGFNSPTGTAPSREAGLSVEIAFSDTLKVMTGRWIPGIVWQRLTLTTGEVVDLQIERDEGGVVSGLALDPCGWPREHVWEIAPALIVRRAPLIQGEATGLLEDVAAWPATGEGRPQ